MKKNARNEKGNNSLTMVIRPIEDEFFQEVISDDEQNDESNR
jgi:hypothetical protein